jgi:Na+-driven multidrug efflux pump
MKWTNAPRVDGMRSALVITGILAVTVVVYRDAALSYFTADDLVPAAVREQAAQLAYCMAPVRVVER